MNNISVIQYKEGLEQLVKLAIKRELIPFFGAGFTAGCEASEGVVPDSKGAMISMRKLILEKTSLCSNLNIQTLDFFALSDLFFEFVPFEDRTTYFEKNYTGVTLYPIQKSFLSDIDWPYAYTINIDDGIEKNSTFVPILPYHKLRRPRVSKKLLYKLHGDALHESKYKDGGENIVFSQKQYLNAITDEQNCDIYNTLLSDFAQRHILFIGCSLQSESDLMFVYQKSLQYNQNTFRVVLRTQVPDIIEQQNLKQHGINEIIIVDNYEQFYPDFLNLYNELKKESRETIYQYFNPQIDLISDKEGSLKLLAGANIFNDAENKFHKGAFHILREVVNDISKCLENNFCVLLKGRRFSGKTYILCSITERFKTNDIFYFPSTTFADEEIVENLLLTSKNSLFLFDSNSITPDVYGLLLQFGEKLESNNNRLVIAINSSDNYMPTKLKCEVFEISNQFKKESEIILSQKSLDSFGLIRRKYGHTNIDFLYKLKNEQNVSIPWNDKADQVYTSSEKRIIFALSALDKLYYSDLIALKFTQKEINDLCIKVEPFIEFIPTSSQEATRHSNMKLVHNSKIALTEILKRFTDDDILNSVMYIVKEFRPDYNRRRLYIEIILFDTLNQLFNGREKSKELIATIYAKLQSLLNDDLHYWLQRAKSIYRTKCSETDLNEAYTYAKKAYLDGYGSINIKAALTIALISCALSEFTEEQKLGYSEEAVLLAYEAVFSDFFEINPNYLQAEIQIGRNTHSEQRIINACEYVIENSNDSNYVEKGKRILGQFALLKEKKMKKYN